MTDDPNEPIEEPDDPSRIPPDEDDSVHEASDGELAPEEGHEDADDETRAL